MISSSVVELKKEQYVVGIIAEIYQYGATTIAKLAKRLKTSVPSITLYINELIEQGWVEEEGPSLTKIGQAAVAV